MFRPLLCIISRSGISACSSCDSGAYSRSSYSSGDDGGGDDDGGGGNSGDDGGGGNSGGDGGGSSGGGMSEQTHYSQQVDLLQKALLLLPQLRC